MPPEASGPEAAKEGAAPLQWAAFLESTPPGTRVDVEGAYHWEGEYLLSRPQLSLHCPVSYCGGTRFFKVVTISSGPSVYGNQSFHVLYRCKNCEIAQKFFAVLLAEPPAEASPSVVSRAQKVGEVPPFGLRVPERVLKLLGGDRGLFLQGKAAENRGLGLGAFTYYRRVLGNQRTRIVDEILKVADRVGVPPEVRTQLQEARTAWRFEQSIDQIREAIPETLKINGHNPLVLLHDALSDAMHDRSDEECLAQAANVRLVLTELAERIDRALEDKAELASAVKNLMRTGQERAERKGRKEPKSEG